MIKVYRTKASDKRVRQIVSWLESYNLDFQIVPKKEITEETMVEILELSELGFDEIMVPPDKLSANNAKIIKHLNLEKMTTKNLIELVVKHPQLLRDPITIDERHMLVGYNGEEIRQFIPRSYRVC